MSDRPVIDHAATIRAAIQAMLDAEGDGYVAEQLVIAMGITARRALGTLCRQVSSVTTFMSSADG